MPRHRSRTGGGLTMTAAEMERAGRALFGDAHWQSGLSVLLLGKRSSETSRVRNWLAGEPIPAGIRLDLIAALRARAIEIERVADALSADQSAA